MNFADLKTEKLEQACKYFQVGELYIFGSALSENFSATSDLDFLVLFKRDGYKGAFDQFMGFKEKLEEIYRRPVDLLTLGNFRNPLFREEVEKSKILLYAA
jgi:predicted nucleotidyltransferase